MLIDSERSYLIDDIGAPLVNFPRRSRTLNGRCPIPSRHGIATHIAAWVRDMEDDEAFLELVRGNNQGELKPLEIGLHALQYVEKGSKWSDGKGLKHYASEVGRSPSTITEIRQAAEVFHQIRTSEFDGELSHSVKNPGRSHTINGRCPIPSRHGIATHRLAVPLPGRAEISNRRGGKKPRSSAAEETPH